jgi:hypothetical protein
MFIPDPNYSIPDSGSKEDSGSATKNFSIFNPKLGKIIWDLHPGYRIRIFLIRKTAVVIPGCADAVADTHFLYSTSVKVVNTQCCRAKFRLRRGSI